MASEAGANGDQVGMLIFSQGGGKELLPWIALVIIVVVVASVLVGVVVVSVVVLVVVVLLVAVVLLVVVVSLVEGMLHGKEFHMEVVNLHGHGIMGNRCCMGIGSG